MAPSRCVHIPFNFRPSVRWAARLTLPLVLAVAAPSLARADFWYAQLSADGNDFKGCAHERASVDAALKMLSERDSSCHLDTSPVALVTGYFIRCNAGAVMAFRSERDCNFFTLSFVAKEKPDMNRLAPPGTKNPAGWVNSMAGCLSTTVNGFAVARGRVQASANYCECAATAWSGNLLGDEDVLKLKDQFKSSMLKCARDHLDTAVTDEAVERLWALVVAARKARGGKANEATSDVGATGEKGPASVPATPTPDRAAREPSAP